MPYLELAEFGSVALIRSSDLRFDLLSTLVERWRPETHTFHFPCGECTVTLEDVAVQLGLPVDGNPITGLSSLTDPAAVCYKLLGESPKDGDKYFSTIKFTWLRAKICRLSATASEGELMCAARAYIMHLIGALLMPDANGDSVHLSYLPLLADLSTARSYSWGSAVLAMLYKELCRATDPQCKDIGGCLILLQSWALYRMPWTTRPSIGKSCDVPIYRMRIEQHAREGFIWMPYRRPKIANVVPPSALVDSHTWCTNTPIINFNVVEWYNGDRVLRQFGCIQHIPDPPCQLGDDHGLTKRGRVQLDWGIYHRKYVALWYDRLRRIPQMVMATDLQPSAQYIEWYHSRRKPYLLGA
ncbi:serine/threonine-protein phosphatase 7 long form homolog [Gossypium raimondii]|uniref:serine/threonine-protein phosphatase 7 long form homolog n=1 Tax=Gossypium raimondii TaxID=29730 RepID=UPI00227C6681|nr:serine/threonine-protein phosphatase 7 long form homolog [Gossypium raimondii]